MDRSAFKRLEEEAARLQAEIEAGLPGLAEARRRFSSDRSERHRRTLDERQAALSLLSERLGAKVDAMGELLGAPKGIANGRDDHPRSDISRADLTSDKVPVTSNFEALPSALEAIERFLPRGWLEEEARDTCRLGDATGAPRSLTLTRNMRRLSERQPVHRFRQLVRVAQDKLREHPRYDHFAGAYLVPAAVRLAGNLEALKSVGGPEWLSRVLGKGDVDATLFELLTAAAYVKRGIRTEFIEETPEKSPDIRCHDPFPFVVECKRQQTLCDYEMREEAMMEALFSRIARLARCRGINGRFKLELGLEAEALDLDEVADALLGQCSAPSPERWSTAPFGRSAFESAPARRILSASTRPWSPLVCEEAFGWCADLPDWDGICCAAVFGDGPVGDVVIDPLALIWRNDAPGALRKRSWAPLSLFGTALDQVPGGEVGIVYVSYVEGARAAIADERVRQYERRLQTWHHDPDIRVPAAFLSRLYPRPLGHGEPDLIESTVRIVSERYGDAALFDHIPTLVYTDAPDA